MNQSVGEWPSLVVFDLDFTLWDAGGLWCDCLRPPFRLDGGQVVDDVGRVIRIYPDVLHLLEALPTRGCTLGLASRTGEPEWARKLLGLLGLTTTFRFQAIYPSDKKAHFRQLQSESGLGYEDMLFFDDEDRNIRSVSKLGVHSHLVQRGVRLEDFDKALEGWRTLRC